MPETGSAEWLAHLEKSLDETVEDTDADNTEAAIRRDLGYAGWELDEVDRWITASMYAKAKNDPVLMVPGILSVCMGTALYYFELGIRAEQTKQLQEMVDG